MWSVGLASVAMFVALLFCGTVDLPAVEVWHALTGSDADEISRLIVYELRIPMACCALLSGMALSIAGLLLQTTFNNPLAGPSILGVSTGASLGVAIMMLLLGGGAAVGIGHYAGAMTGALVGAGVMLMLLLGFSKVVKGSAMLLIVGILLGYLASSAISILNFFATQEGVHSFVIWGLGSFSGVTLQDLAVFGPVILLAVAASFLMIKPLNALLLGETYAESMGVNLKGTRNYLLLISGILTAAVTAFCGPIGFLGLVMPHVARLTLNSSNHQQLLPATALWGAASGLLCACISLLCGNGGVLPVNAITPLISVPIIIYVIINRNKLSYFR
jgi:iron complex transport system permease protein